MRLSGQSLACCLLAACFSSPASGQLQNLSLERQSSSDFSVFADVLNATATDASPGGTTQQYANTTSDSDSVLAGTSDSATVSAASAIANVAVQAGLYSNTAIGASNTSATINAYGQITSNLTSSNSLHAAQSFLRTSVPEMGAGQVFYDVLPCPTCVPGVDVATLEGQFVLYFYGSTTADGHHFVAGTGRNVGAFPTIFNATVHNSFLDGLSFGTVGVLITGDLQTSSQSNPTSAPTTFSKLTAGGFAEIINFTEAVDVAESNIPLQSAFNMTLLGTTSLAPGDFDGQTGDDWNYTIYSRADVVIDK